MAEAGLSDGYCGYSDILNVRQCKYLFSVQTRANHSGKISPSLPSVNSESISSPKNIHLFYAYEHLEPGFCASLRTALLNSWRPIVLSTSNGTQFSLGREKNMIKLFLMDLYLANSRISDNDIILVLDAYDTWLQHTPQHVVALFEEIERERLNDAVLFSAEKNCWPPNSHCEDFPQSFLPVDTYGTASNFSDKKYRRPRWLNSGGYIGRKRNVQRVLKRTLNSYEHEEISDQGLLARVYHDQGTDNLIQLDFSSIIFQSMAYSADDIIWVRDYMALMDGKIRPINKFSGTQPVVIHFNGDKKKVQYHWKYSNPAINETLDVRAEYMGVNGQVVTYEETCSGKYAAEMTTDKIW